MKSNWRRTVAVLTTVVLTVLFVAITANITERKASKAKNSVFFKDKTEYDVLFYGSSHMVDAIYPMEMWDKEGIVAYNLGGNGNRIPTSYWIFKNSLDYAKPEVVVLDCTMLSQNLKADTNFSFLHTSLDEFPLSLNKIRAVKDLLDDAEAEKAILEGTAPTNGEERTAFGLLWGYSVYHSRWTELTEDDFSPYIYTEKGAETLVNVAEPTYNKQVGKDCYIDENTVAMDYLVKMIEECKSRDIDIVLVYLPFMATEVEQMEANTMEKIAADKGVDCINFLDLDVVDYTTDCYDGGHMNPSGARKVTNYMSRYLKDNYGIADRRQDESVSSWYQDYKEYMDCEYLLTYREKHLNNYLMLLSGIRQTTVMDVREQKIWKDPLYYSLLKNLNVDVDRLDDDACFIVIKDNVAAIVKNLDSYDEKADTEVGQVTMTKAKVEGGKGFGLELDGELIFTGRLEDTMLHVYSHYENDESADIAFEGQLIEGDEGFEYAVSEADWWR